MLKTRKDELEMSFKYIIGVRDYVDFQKTCTFMILKINYIIFKN